MFRSGVSLLAGFTPPFRTLCRTSSIPSHPMTCSVKTIASLTKDCNLPNTPTPSFPNEYTTSRIKTALPGPKSLALIKRLNERTQSGAVHFFVDYGASRGNYIVDVDQNCYLDVFGQIASLPIGYNHPAILSAMTDPANLSMLAQRPCLGILPPEDWIDRVDRTLMKVAPKGLSEVNTMMCGSCANENAFKAAFIWYQTKVRGNAPPRDIDLSTCMKNQAPGSPDLSVLSFSGGFHGRLLGCMSTTHSKAIHKVDIPAFDWPVAPFPSLKYPLEEYEAENQLEEQRCLQIVQDILQKQSPEKPVAAMIIEPIQAEGGDNHASNEYFRQLRDIASKHEVAFIVDEVQTGAGATGTFWAHEKWELENPPDLVTFSKKMQTGGYYSKPEFRPAESYRIFNTWMGDPTKMIQLEAFLDTMENDQLLKNTQITGDYLKNGLQTLQEKYPILVSNVRGVGTYLAMDFPSTPIRDQIVGRLREAGVEAGGCGDYSIRFRPALVFQPRHANEFLNIFEKICATN